MVISLQEQEYDISSKEHMSKVTPAITDGVGIQIFHF